MPSIVNGIEDDVAAPPQADRDSRPRHLRLVVPRAPVERAADGAIERRPVPEETAAVDGT